ncbi:MAG: hypothetical protein MR488_10425 [Lachnospiraceae bacterium]|nr:hypothetical protein [Lachnospiraceae bacterium]
MNELSINEKGILKKQKLIAVLMHELDLPCKDEFEGLGDCVWKWSRTYQLSSKSDKIPDFTMGIEILSKEQFFMIPCANYNGNQWGSGKEPKGLYHDGKPWKYAWHRSSIPSGMYCQTEEASFGICDSLENTMNSAAVFTRNEDGHLCMKLSFPEDEPLVYCARDKYSDMPYRAKVVIEGDQITFTAYLVLLERRKAYDYGAFMNLMWNQFESKPRKLIDDKTVWDLGIEFILNQAYFEDGRFAGFCMGLTWDGERWTQIRNHLEVGWVGQNASLAVSLLYEGIVNHRLDALHKGRKALDSWTENAVLPNGLFRTRFDRILTYPEDNDVERNDAANLYDVVDEYLEAYHLLKEHGEDVPCYRDVALGVCDFLVNHEREGGKFAKAWHNDGSISDPDGIVGSYATFALCIGYRETKNQAYLKAAKDSFRAYYQEFLSQGFATAGALDTYCIDKEAAIPLARSAVALYEITGEQGYLEAAEQISDYLTTWQYLYNVRFPEDSILHQIEYHTKGGTAVSVQHNHIDCYALEFYDTWIKLAKLTGHKTWKERAQAAWRNSLQNISDGTLVIKGQRRPRGSQDEGFLQTRWHTKKGDYFGVSEWLVVWNTAFRLKILRRNNLTRKTE